jgi:outer membrane protein assembly factor BamB
MHSKLLRTCALLGVLSLLLMAAVAPSADWPQWRGPQRDGSIPALAEPKSWPEKLRPGWKIQVGEGHSSPILAAGRIFVFTRQRDREVASAIDPPGGTVLWQQSYPAPYNVNPAAARHGAGPKSTPAFDTGRLYTFGISGILTCRDAGTGAIRWQKEFSKRFPETSPLFGTAMSPLVAGGLVIIHSGGHDHGALTAFDAESGSLKWQWDGDGPGYASPVVANFGGTRQVVTETQSNIVGVSLTDGRLLWRIPFTTEYVQNIPTPLVLGDRIIVSGLSKGVMAVKPELKDGRWSVETIWRNPSFSMYMSSPVREGDLLFGFSHTKKGQFFCLNSVDGSTLWSSDPRQGDNAALIVTGGNLIALKDDAELIVARAGGKGFEPLHRYTVADSPTWAHPLLLPDGVVIKDATMLALWKAE